MKIYNIFFQLKMAFQKFWFCVFFYNDDFTFYVLETRIDEEIAQQAECAQKIYESLVPFGSIPTLLRPSLYQPCKNFRTTAEEKEIAKVDLTKNQKREDNDKISVKNQNDSKQQNLKIKRLCKIYNTKIKKCKCKDNLKPQAKENTNCNKYAKSCKKTIKTQKSDSIFKNDIEENEPESNHLCKCWKTVQKTIKKPFCSCEKCLRDRKFCENFSSVLSDVTKEIPCNCLEQYQAKVKKYKNFEKRKAMICALKQQKSKYGLIFKFNTSGLRLIFYFLDL